MQAHGGDVTIQIFAKAIRQPREARDDRRASGALMP
jgi:hypothetical protein